MTVNTATVLANTAAVLSHMMTILSPSHKPCHKDICKSYLYVVRELRGDVLHLITSYRSASPCMQKITDNPGSAKHCF